MSRRKEFGDDQTNIRRSNAVSEGLQGCSGFEGNLFRYPHTDAGIEDTEKGKQALLYVRERGGSEKLGPLYIPWLQAEALCDMHERKAEGY